MAKTYRSSSNLKIPDGLEVVPSMGPEAIHHDGLEFVAIHHHEKDAVSRWPEESESQGVSPKRRLTRLQKLLIAAAIIILIIGGVVGGILGSRIHNSSDNALAASSTPSPTSSSQSTATSTGPSSSPTASSSSSPSLRENSALSVTGWSSSAGFSIRLFFQGGDGKIRQTGFDSSSKDWGPPVILDIGAKPGTSLGTSSIAEPAYFGFTDDSSGFQVELFYLTEQNTLQEWTFKDALAANGSASELGIAVPPSSKIVSYWPSIMYQTASGVLAEMILATSWNIRLTGSSALAGSALVTLPAHSNYTDGGNRVFYQQQDGTLSSIVGSSSAGWTNEPSIATIPKGASIGAFVVLNKRKAPNLDTYVLYQDATGDIQVMFQNDETGWKGPTSPAAFQGADNGTSIACLTPMAWPGTPLQQGAVQTCRCYFQSSVSIKEVWFDGTGWQAMGSVPTT